MHPTGLKFFTCRLHLYSGFTLAYAATMFLNDLTEVIFDLVVGECRGRGHPAAHAPQSGFKLSHVVYTCTCCLHLHISFTLAHGLTLAHVVYTCTWGVYLHLGFLLVYKETM